MSGDTASLRCPYIWFEPISMLPLTQEVKGIGPNSVKNWRCLFRAYVAVLALRRTIFQEEVIEESYMSAVGRKCVGWHI